MRKRRNISISQIIALVIILSFILALIYIATVDVEISTTEVQKDISGQLFTNER